MSCSGLDPYCQYENLRDRLSAVEQERDMLKEALGSAVMFCERVPPGLSHSAAGPISEAERFVSEARAAEHALGDADAERLKWWLNTGTYIIEELLDLLAARSPSRTEREEG